MRRLTTMSERAAERLAWLSFALAAGGAFALMIVLPH